MTVLITEIDDNTSPSHWPARANHRVRSSLIGRCSVDPPCSRNACLCWTRVFPGTRVNTRRVSRHAFSRPAFSYTRFPNACFFMRLQTCDACLRHAFWDPRVNTRRMSQTRVFRACVQTCDAVLRCRVQARVGHGDLFAAPARVSVFSRGHHGLPRYLCSVDSFGITDANNTYHL